MQHSQAESITTNWPSALEDPLLEKLDTRESRKIVMLIAQTQKEDQKQLSTLEKKIFESKYR